jgi:hypothetical protein
MNEHKQETFGILGRQSLRRSLTAAESRLAAALEEIFGAGIHEFPQVVDALRKRGVARPSGAADPWTLQSLEYELKLINESLDRAYLGVERETQARS